MNARILWALGAGLFAAFSTFKLTGDKKDAINNGIDAAQASIDNPAVNEVIDKIQDLTSADPKPTPPINFEDSQYVDPEKTD